MAQDELQHDGFSALATVADDGMEAGVGALARRRFLTSALPARKGNGRTPELELFGGAGLSIICRVTGFISLSRTTTTPAVLQTHSQVGVELSFLLFVNV